MERADTYDPGTKKDAQRSAFEAEHWLAWLFSAGALVLGILGLLRAFGVYGPMNTTTAGQVTSISPGGLPDTLWDGGLLLLAGIASALLAYALHRADHHRMRDPDHMSDRDEGLWKLEHALAYVMAIATIVFTILGLLTGYNKMGGHHWQPDGIPWLLSAIGTGVLTNVLHAVRHHQTLWWNEPYVRSEAGSDYMLERSPQAPQMSGEYRPDGPVPAEHLTAEQTRRTTGMPGTRR